MPALPSRRSERAPEREGGRLGVEEPGRDHRVAERAGHRGAEAPQDLPVVLDVVADEDHARRGEEALQLSSRGLLSHAALLGAGEGDVAGLLELVGEGEADEPRGELVDVVRLAVEGEGPGGYAAVDPGGEGRLVRDRLVFAGAQEARRRQGGRWAGQLAAACAESAATVGSCRVPRSRSLAS